jgi:hypothetical protein
MGGERWAADWEQVIGRDLVPQLIPGERPGCVHRPAGLPWLPADSQADLAACVGRIDLANLLVVPAAAWRWNKWRRLSLYMPLSVAAIGERGAALWVQAPPAPGVRIEVPFSDIAAVEQHHDGAWRVLVVTGRTSQLVIRYHQDADACVDAWTRRLRLRAAAVSAPVPSACTGSAARRRAPSSNSLRRGAPELGSFLLSSGDRIVSAGTSKRSGLFAVTSRELIVVQSLRARRRPWHQATRTMYVPRLAVEEAVVRAKSVWLRSAGTGMRARLSSPKVSAAASSWLTQLLSDRTGAGS